MNIIFTDYGTIIVDNMEITVKDFFDDFEKKFKHGKISECNYDSMNEVFTYRCSGKKYNVKISDKNAKYLRVLLSFSELEKAKKQKSEKKINEEDRKYDLLRAARNGEIKSTEAKLLYLDELRDKLKLSSMLKEYGFFADFAFEFLDIDIDRISDFSFKVNLALMPLYIILFIFSSPIFGSETTLGMALTGLSWFGCTAGFITSLYSALFNNHGTFVSKLLSYVIWAIINVIGNVITFPIITVNNIREFITQSKLIKQKIKSLEEYKCSNQEIKITNGNNVWLKDIERIINNLYSKVAMLNIEDRKQILGELTEKLKEYKAKLNSIPETGLTLDTVSTLSVEFCLYLTVLEDRINKLMNKVDVIVPDFENIDDEDTFGKVRSRSI